MRFWAKTARFVLCAVALATPLSAGNYFKPADFDDDNKFPDPNRTVSIAWPSIDEKDGPKATAPAVKTLAENKNAFGPGREGDKPIQYTPDPANPGKKQVELAESQEGLSGSQAPQGLKNWERAMVVHYRVYTVLPPVDESLYTGDDVIVTEFDPARPNPNKQIKVGYEWTLTPKAGDKLGTFEFNQTLKDLKLADDKADVGGKKLSDNALLGGSAWLPFADTDAAGNLTNQQPAPFNGRPAKGQLSSNDDRVPPFSYTASTPGDYTVGFKLAVVRFDGSAQGKPEAGESGECKRSLDVANLTPPMLMTGAAPGPVFSTTGDPLDDENSSRTPDLPQDDLYTVIWVMSNAHAGATVDKYAAEHVEKILVSYPKFVDNNGLAFMPDRDQNISVDPLTGEIKGENVYNGGDTFGLGTAGSGRTSSAGTPALQGDAQVEADLGNPPLMGKEIADEFAQPMEAAASQAKSMDEFAKGSFQNEQLTQDILTKTKGKEGLVATIQLPSNFPMPECQMAMLSAFKVKVPITTAPINFEGKIPWTVSAVAEGSQPAGTMDGSLAVIDNKPPDLTIAVQNPKTGSTRILQINNTGGAQRTLDPEPFAVRKGELAVGSSPTSSETAKDKVEPQVTATQPLQEQKPFPNEQQLAAKGIAGSDGSSEIIDLPKAYSARKGAVIETIELPADTVPADEDVRLTVQIFPTDNVTTWDEMYLKIFDEEALGSSDPDSAKPIFEGPMSKFKKEQDGRFVSNARTTSDQKQSKMRVEVYDFDPNQVPYKGPSLNPKCAGKDTLRLFANCRKIIIPVARGGVSMEMREVQSESQRGGQ